MLKSLTISNFALIEQAHLEFSDGLNILTGETGAGKSILIDALAAVTGGRVSQDAIRGGADQFRVEACFDIGGAEHIGALLEEQGISPEEDGSLIISRRVNRHGKNAIIVNGCQTTLSALRKIGEEMIDMHGQHENQALLKPGAYLVLLDTFDNECAKLRQKYQEIYQKWKTANAELESARQNSRDILQRQDMLIWQTQEIAAASLSAAEEEKIEQEVKILANAEKISTAVNNSYTLLSQGQRGAKSIVDALAEVRRGLDTASRYDEKLAPYLTVVEDCFYQLEEVASELRDYGEDMEFNPKRLADLEQRLDVIYKLKRKYGAEIEDILKYYEEALEELTKIENYDKHIDDLEKACATLCENLGAAAEKLDKSRRLAARGLEKELAANLKDLALPKALFQIEVNRTEDFLPSGQNEVAFLFSANPGENVKMLNKIASGGELSRVALAIKAVCASREQPDVMIFDEIDAGIGGQTAQMVAEKIAALAAGPTQILCITHLPQIACMADCHIHVAKHIKNERTATLVEILKDGERIGEIAKMLSGSPTEQALRNAAQMLETAKNKKIIWQNKAQA